MSKTKKAFLCVALAMTLGIHEMTFKEEQTKGIDYANTNFTYPAYHGNDSK